jgi:hypothetical protein
MDRRLLSRLRQIGAVVVMVGIIAFAVTKLDWKALVAAFTHLEPASALGCAAMVGASQLLMAVRWALLATPPSDPVRWSEMLVALHGNLFNLVTPAAIGSDVYKVVGARGRSRGRGFSTGLVLIDRLIGVWSYAAVFLLALTGASRSLFGGDGSHGAWSAALTVALPVFVGMVVAIPLVVLVAAGPWTERLIAAHVPWIRELQRAALVVVRECPPARRIVVVGLGLAPVVCWIAGAAVLAHGTDLNLRAIPLALIVILTEFVRLVPVSVQGVGVREAAFAWFASIAGGAAATAFVVCTVLYVINTIVAAGLGSAAGFWLGGSGLKIRDDGGEA